MERANSLNQRYFSHIPKILYVFLIILSLWLGGGWLIPLIPEGRGRGISGEKVEKAEEAEAEAEAEAKTEADRLL